MQKKLKERILGLTPAREIPIDVAKLVTIPEGQPRLFEETFPYVEAPRFMFSGKVTEVVDGHPVTFDFDARKRAALAISDTTFRDGQQARPPYTRKQIIDLYRLLGRLSGPNQVITATEFFVYSDGDIAALEACLEEHRVHPSYPEPTCWIRGLTDDAIYLKLMQHLGVRETGILTSCSDYHVFLKLRKNWRTASIEFLNMAKLAAERDIRVRFHLEDVTRANMDEFVYPFLEMIARFSDAVPDSLRPKIRLCDTMGFGLPYPGVDLPRSVPKLVHKVRQAGIPSHRIEWHGHNDFHLVIANAVAAWLYGCDVLNGTLLGFGERTGNPPIEAAVIMYQALKGVNGTDSRVISEIADYFRAIGVIVPPNYPLVGDDSNRTRAGIHGGGLALDERIYQIFDTSRILGRPPAITITDKSGLEGIAYWVQCYLAQDVAERAEIAVKKTRIVEIAKWVDHHYDHLERATSISDDEMAEQILLHIPEAAVPARINKRYNLKDKAVASADDCVPIIAWIKDEKKRRAQEAREKGRTDIPLDGISMETLDRLVREHLPHLRR
ncbi:MAG: 2-isopropylmalate synthase [Verrucomicrobiota bacterium]|nr:2-isopropylmalate synthase [Verrucomicrobiota bacterium]